MEHGLLTGQRVRGGPAAVGDSCLVLFPLTRALNRMKDAALGASESETRGQPARWRGFRACAACAGSGLCRDRYFALGKGLG